MKLWTGRITGIWGFSLWPPRLNMHTFIFLSLWIKVCIMWHMMCPMTKGLEALTEERKASLNPWVSQTKLNFFYFRWEPDTCRHIMKWVADKRTKMQTENALKEMSLSLLNSWAQSIYRHCLRPLALCQIHKNIDLYTQTHFFSLSSLTHLTLEYQSTM